jgi:CBS domain containing-hemolysin-like protein
MPVEWVLLGVSVLLILACGGFVAAEFAFVTVDRSAVERAAAAGDTGAQGVKQALSTLSSQLSGAQVGITVTNLAIGFLAEPAIATLVRDPLRALGVTGDAAVTRISVAIGLLLATFLTMIFGELVPKNLAIANPMRTAKGTQRFQRGFTRVMALPIRGLNGTANAIVRSFGIEPQEELRSARSIPELSSVIGRSASEGTLDPATAGLMQRSVSFGSRTAGEIMTPRMQVSALKPKDTALAVIELARSSGHSRFPVLEGEAEDVVGVVHIKHVVNVPRRSRSSVRVSKLMVEAPVVPESLRLDPLLGLLRQESFQLAVVIDEYGGTAGVVTIEDVVEEIVGEISDEHDPLDSSARPNPDGTWTLSGQLRPDEVEDATGVALPEHEDYDTIAGLVLRELGHVPEVGERVEIVIPGGFSREGEEMPARRVELYVARRVGLRIDRLRMGVLDEEPLHE